MEYEILYKKYPNVKLTKLEGGYTNKAFFLDGLNPPIMAKVYKKDNIDAKIEFNALAYMNNSNISPNVYEYIEDSSQIYIIMEYIQGNNGQIYLDNGDYDKVYEIYKLLGIYLAKKIHSIKLINNTENIPLKNFEDINMDCLKYLSSNMVTKIKNILNIEIKNENILTHGDYGIHNALVSNNKLKIIDWEWAGWGNSQLDVSWVIWFLHLHYPNICKKLSKIFLNEYCSNREIEMNEEIIKAFSIYKVIKILEKAVSVNEEVKKEWIKRLEWTIKTDFNI